jgi:hypothetical protein
VVKGVVNSLVGGVPVRTGSASINSIIDVYLQLYLPRAEELGYTIVKLDNENQKVGNLDFPHNAIDIRSSTDPGTRFFTFSNFGVRNLETVHELSLYPSHEAISHSHEFSFFFKLGGGKIWDRDNEVCFLRCHGICDRLPQEVIRYFIQSLEVGSFF